MLILRQPYLGRDSVCPARGDGDGHTVSGCFQAFVLWWLSLAVCCASSESQSSNGRISASVSEQRDRGPFSTDVLATLTLFLLVLLNPAASRDVRLTPGIPGLTSSAGASLYFCVSNATHRQLPRACSQSSQSQSISSEHTQIPSSVRSLVSHAPGSGSHSAVSQVPSVSPPAPPCRWPASHQLPATRCELLELPVSVWIQ